MKTEPLTRPAIPSPHLLTASAAAVFLSILYILCLEQGKFIGQARTGSYYHFNRINIGRGDDGELKGNGKEAAGDGP
jgi:hypothetical protein